MGEVTIKNQNKSYQISLEGVNDQYTGTRSMNRRDTESKGYILFQYYGRGRSTSETLLIYSNSMLYVVTVIHK